MRPRLFALWALCAALTLLLLAGSLLAAAQPAPAPAMPDPHTAAQVLRSSPVMFIENVGQFPEGARFQVRGGTGAMWLVEDTNWVTTPERSRGYRNKNTHWSHESPRALNTVFSDNFDDNVLNSSMWTAGTTGLGPTVVETNHRLEITFPASSLGSDFGAGYGSVCQLRGDFDIQVDYLLLVWPSSNGVRVGLSAARAQVERVSFGNNDFPGYPREVYLTHFSDGVRGITGTNDLAGSLRLIRSGNSLTGYYSSHSSGYRIETSEFSAGPMRMSYSNSDIWIAIHSAPVTTSDVPFGISAWSHDRHFRDLEVRIAFDNFMVNQGQLICPTIPASQGSFRLIAASSYTPVQPIAPTVRVDNPTYMANAYTVIVSLLQGGATLDSQPRDVTVPGGGSATLSDFNFGTRPAGSYRLWAELRLGGTLLSTQTAGITVLDLDAQRVAEDYAGKLKQTARDEFDQMAGIPARIIARDIVNWGWDRVESLFGQYFQEAAAPVKEADPVGASDPNVDRGLQEGQALLRQAGEKVRLYTAARLRQIIYERTGVLLPEWFDPLNPEASLRDLTAEVKGMIKEIIAEEVTGIVREYFFKALFTNPQMNRIETRHSQFDTYMANLLPTWSWTPSLEQTFDRGRDAIRNTVESDAIVTLGPVSVLGRSLRYDVTLLEQQRKYDEIKGLQGLLGKITLALTVIGVVIAVLIFIGAVVSTGPLATAILPLIWKVVGFLAKAKDVLLPLGLTFLTVTMAVSVPILAPRITARHDNTLDEVEAIISSPGQAVTLKEMTVVSARNGEPVRLQAIVESQERTHPASPVVETAIYSVDGRAVQVLWAQPTLGPYQSARLEKEISLPAGSYRAVSTVHTGEQMAIAVQSQAFAVTNPELQLALTLNKTLFTLGEAVRAAVSITNTNPISNVNDLTLIVESSDGQNFNAWPISLGPGETQRVDYAFVPPAEGSYVLRATLAVGLNELAVQDVAYVVGSGASLALNVGGQAVYNPGLAVTIPITATNAGNLPTSTVLSLVTLNRLHELAAVYTDTLPLSVDAGASVATTAIALPTALAQPGLYTARLFLGDALYTSLDFAVAAEDTLFADIYPDSVFPAVGDAVTLTVQVMNSVYTYTDALVDVSLWWPDGITQTATMNPIGTGQYQGTVTAPIAGTYLATVEVSKPNYRAVGNSTFFVAGERSQLLPTVDGRPLLGTTQPVTVTVRNEQGVPIVGASLTVSGTLEYLSRQTDEAGQAVLQLSPTITEPYQVSLEKLGFAQTVMDLPVWVAADTTPPALFLDAPPATNRTPLTVTGLTETGVTLTVDSAIVAVDAQGRFTTTVTLNEGANTLNAAATDAADNTTTVTRTVTLDTVPPTLTVTYPPDGLITTQEVISVTGTTEVGASLTVSGTLTTVDPASGTFSAWALLQPDANTLPITAADAAGNTTTVTRSIVYASHSAVIAFFPGWNLVSIPLTLPSAAITDVLASIAGSYDQVWAYDACDTADPWKKHIPGDGDNDLTAMDVRHGYWLHATAAVTLTVTGSQPTTTTIPLCAGWNLVGYPSSTARPVGEALAGIAGKYDLVQGYDPAQPIARWRRYDPALSPARNGLTEMAPGWGYWIRMTEDATLTVAP